MGRVAVRDLGAEARSIDATRHRAAIRGRVPWEAGCIEATRHRAAIRGRVPWDSGPSRSSFAAIGAVS